MSTSNIFTIIGIVVTSIFGIWGIIVVVRRRYPGEITYVKESYIGLFDSIVKNLPELSVLYNNNPVGQGLVLVKGDILNTGSKDITESMIEKEITLSLPDEFHWLTAKIVSCSPNVNAEISFDSQNLSFSTGLFRCNEFIRFQAIAEIPIHPSKNEKIEQCLEKAITINHRIADTKKVVSLNLPNKTSEKNVTFRYFLPVLFLTITIIILSFIGFYTADLETHFIVFDANSIQHEVIVKPKLDGNIILKGVKDNFSKVIPADEFFKQGNYKTKIVRSSVKTTIFFISLFIPLFWLSNFIKYREQKKGEKLRQLLGIDDN